MPPRSGSSRYYSTKYEHAEFHGEKVNGSNVAIDAVGLVGCGVGLNKIQALKAYPGVVQAASYFSTAESWGSGVANVANALQTNKSPDVWGLGFSLGGGITGLIPHPIAQGASCVCAAGSVANDLRPMFYYGP